MSAEIIDFTTRHRTPGADDAPRRTQTAKNQDLRDARREAWRKADARVCYWSALLKYRDTVCYAKGCGVKEARAHTEINSEDHEARWLIVESYREALGEQLLTPAHDMASVNWKRRQLSKTYIGVKKELVEKAIADDIAFLDAHPTRRSGRVA